MRYPNKWYTSFNRGNWAVSGSNSSVTTCTQLVHNATPHQSKCSSSKTASISWPSRATEVSYTLWPRTPIQLKGRKSTWLQVGRTILLGSGKFPKLLGSIMMRRKVNSTWVGNCYIQLQFTRHRAYWSTWKTSCTLWRAAMMGILDCGRPTYPAHKKAPVAKAHPKS